MDTEYGFLFHGSVLMTIFKDQKSAKEFLNQKIFNKQVDFMHETVCCQGVDSAVFSFRITI